jgi:hypothetical protein
MKLHKLHVHQLSTRFVRDCHPIARVLPRVRRDAPRFADAAGGNDDRLRLEHNEAPAFAPVTKCARNPFSILHQFGDGAFHEDVDA